MSARCARRDCTIPQHWYFASERATNHDWLGQWLVTAALAEGQVVSFHPAKSENYLQYANRRLEANPDDVGAKLLRVASLRDTDQAEAADEAAIALLSEHDGAEPWSGFSTSLKKLLSKEGRKKWKRVHWRRSSATSS